MTTESSRSNTFDLTEWRDPSGQVRIRIDALHVLQDISDQYIERRKDWRVIWNYVQHFGVIAVMRKIRSRLSEQGRNRKVAAIGLGEILQGAENTSLIEGQKVAFLAPNHNADRQTTCLNTALVARWPFSASPTPGATQGTDEGLKALAPVFGWSPFSGVPLAGDDIRRGLINFVPKLEQIGHHKPTRTSSRKLSAGAVERLEKPQEPTDKPTAVIFGLGNYAKTQIVPNIQRRLHLSCVHEVDPEQLKTAAEWGVSLDTSPVPRHGEVYDAWFIAGYHHTHGPLATQALASGAYAVIEKPLVTTNGQFQLLRDTLMKQQRFKFFSCFHKRYSNLNQFVRQDIDLSSGVPVDMHCIVYEIPLPRLHWYNWPNSGSRIISNGCHWLDYFMFVNDYCAVDRFDLWKLRDKDLAIVVRLENEASLVMSLTDKGSERLGVRDVIELRSADTTVRIIDGRSYLAENSKRMLRQVKTNPVHAYRNMYDTITVRIADGEAGDHIDTLRSTELMLDLEALLTSAQLCSGHARR